MIVALQTLVFFRESLLAALDRIFRPYYKHFTLAFSGSGNALQDEEADDQVFAEYDEEKGVTFYPPMYAQRYAAVSDCLMDERWCGRIEKVVDFGHHDMSFIKYLKEVPGIRCILGVDIETIPLRCSSDLIGSDEYTPKRESPLQVTLFQGNAADPDYRLIGCDAVIAIEMIEHMLPHDLDRLVHTVFGFVKPWIVVFTTPNADFNVLFKALEKNGLRRWDHLFEWTREQFHDWCSNIVVRYPNYTVVCQGVGPGPPGTSHYGCCSQLSLFISKNYLKQADLHLNSLAIVTNAPTPNNFSEVFECWESTVGTRHEVDCGTDPEPPTELNCTTLEVKKFSKTTQNLMAKNRFDSLVHTREVVNEIRHLTKTLNFNKCSQPGDGSHLWCNINWGDNAPYWNQYYKLVREYIYPFEAKSEEVRILDLVSEEINRLIDTQFDEEFSVDVNRLEIPISHLMNVVQHITNDVDKVRDLLEWNGYEIVNDVVIHSRLVVDTTSVATHDEDWQDNDTAYSDWDTTEVHSTSMSDGSTVVPDIPGRWLRRALDQKVRNLRTMISADEDITTELDRVVCRLMKLALQSSRGRQTPPPTRWMQCKLLDLLTLTEKAIGRRKKSFIESSSVKAITFDSKPQSVQLEQDSRVNEIVDKYRHLIQPMEKTTNTDETNGPLTDVEMEDEFMSTTSNEFLKDFELVEGISPSLVIPQPVLSTEEFVNAESPTDENPLERTKAWLDEDVEEAPYSKLEVNYEHISSGDTDHSVTNARHKHKKSGKKHKNKKNILEDSKESDTFKTCVSKTSNKLKIKRDDKKKKNFNTRVSKKVPKKKPSFNSLAKNTGNRYSSADCDNYVGSKRNKEQKSLNVTASKPIPKSLIELCHPELKADKGIEPFLVTTADEDDVIVSTIPSCNISATEESCHIDIVMQDFEETIALRRSIGTDADETPVITNSKIDTLSNEVDVNLFTKHQVSTENVQSQTIFLNDINEPSTSKGIRHNVSTDVQCGPDTLVAYPMLSASTSLVKMPQVFSTGIKIHDVGAETKVQGTDFGTSTQDNNNFTTLTPRLRSVGIKIKDSDVNICSQTECSTMTAPEPAPVVSRTATPETKLLKPISSTLKMEDSGSEMCMSSLASSSKTLSNFLTTSKYDVLIEASASKEPVTDKIIVPSKSHKCLRPKLCCGGVYVHSYKDKQVSEDIVYQGEWQRHRPKALTRKMSCNFASARKANEAAIRKIIENSKERPVASKEKISKKRQDKQKGTDSPETRTTKSYKLKLEENMKQIKPPHDYNSAINVENRPARIPKPIKTVTKIADTEKDKLNKSLDSASEVVKAGRKITSKETPLVRSKTEEIRITQDLLKFSDEVRENISYVVFRNDLENKIGTPNDQPKDNKIGTANDQSKENKDHTKSTSKPIDIPKRTRSPPSLNSSTCSSPNSIATVRAVSTRSKNLSNRRHSASSSFKSNLTNSESDNPTPTKTKKVIKRCKPTKKPENKDVDNKENIPESTKNFISKVKDKLCKSPFGGRTKRACIAEINTESSSPQNTLSRKAQISNKSDVKNSPRKEAEENRRTSSPTVSKKRSLKSDTSSIHEEFDQSLPESSDSLDSTNMVLVLEPQQNYEGVLGTQNVFQISSTECSKENDKTVKAELVRSSSLQSHASSIINSMRQIVEETVDLVVSPYERNTSRIDSQTVILSRNDIHKLHMEKIALLESKAAGKTVETFNKSFLENDIENALNRTFDSVLGDESMISLNDTRRTVTDLDLLSFKSITSVSKFSEYYLADNEFNTSPSAEEMQLQNSTSVRDIFERKEQHLTQSIPGALAVQAFSGFSLDVEPVAGDQPDPVALIDSETGSLCLDINRQATSEELFISGRSSDSYESCLIDEDAVVPNWLFQLISQQQSVEEDPPIGAHGAAPPDEPIYDANGNIIEPSIIGVGAGAGDGRGIHSDHSQDSSGRGTSLSSSDSSSGPQSEVSAIMIDPSAFTAQFELLGDPMASSAMVQVEAHHSHNHTYRIDEDTGTLITSREVRARIRNGASDVDADVSSIDTDVPDSSDN
uniref:Small RNA 2'-O-methyltransferase n=1 Tax=Heliothis virescens TaxID=7102 RepID=A0A2A4JR26_HELVI